MSWPNKKTITQGAVAMLQTSMGLKAGETLMVATDVPRSGEWKTASPGKAEHHEDTGRRDLMKMALYPLAVPYLLNPAGIAALVIASNEINSVAYLLILVGLVLLVGVLDWLVFRNMDKLPKHLAPSRLAVTEAVFGVLLSALAVQLTVDGLADLGIIEAIVY